MSPSIGNWFVNSLRHLSLRPPPVVGLYSERKSRENATLSGLSRAETVKATRLLMEFWPSIGDGGFNVGNTKVGRKAPIGSPRLTSTTFIASTRKGLFATSLIGLL
ncbi:hypothetical protein Tco_1370311, partial [Tanacetum coccineum]